MQSAEVIRRQAANQAEFRLRKPALPLQPNLEHALCAVPRRASRLPFRMGLPEGLGLSPDGPVLFTASGRALYLRSFDAFTGPSLPLHSTCTDACATAW